MMRVSDFWPDELNPTSLYVLSDQLELMQKIRKELLGQEQIDILQLSDILHIRTAEGKLIAMAPPFVEFYPENVRIIPLPGDKPTPERLSITVPILKDGIHRTWLAREEGVKIRCIVVSGALAQHKPYAYPNSWDQVGVYESKPENKKFYRRHNEYSYLRPLKALRQTGDAPPPPEWGR